LALGPGTFTVWGQSQGVAALSLDSGRWELVLPASRFAAGRFEATSGTKGRILVVDQNAGIMAAPFDVAHPASNRGGDWDIYGQSPDGSKPAEVVLKRPYDQFPYSMSPDWTLRYHELHPKTARDLWTLSSDGKTSLVRGTAFNETSRRFSPGPAGGPRWIAYASDESGRSEIYVQSYPGGANRIPVSTGGGVLPRWSGDGKELFYMAGDALMAVAMRPDGSFDAPRRLFDRSAFVVNPRFHSYAVSADGKRFLMMQREPASVPRQLNVILNWSGPTSAGRPAS
jgi:eukaryotic-like serine/threonine-protein kinase